MKTAETSLFSVKILGGLFTALLISCGPVHEGETVTKDISPGRENAKTCSSGFQSFEQSLNKINEASCSKCHGRSQTPRFAVNDLETSYLRSIPMVNFNQVEKSLYLKQATNNHCEDESCNLNKEEVLSALKTWVKAEIECEDKDDSAPSKPKTDPSLNLKYFEENVRPVLISEQKCHRCHAKKKQLSLIPVVAYANIFKNPPRFLKGSIEEQYQKAKSQMALDKDSFYASYLYINSHIMHFENGICEEDESPCKEIKTWWLLEKGILDQAPVDERN